MKRLYIIIVALIMMQCTGSAFGTREGIHQVQMGISKEVSRKIETTNLKTLPARGISMQMYGSANIDPNHLKDEVLSDIDEHMGPDRAPFRLDVPDYYEIYNNSPDYWKHTIPGKVVVKYVHGIDASLRVDLMSNFKEVQEVQLLVHNRILISLWNPSVTSTKKFITSIKKDKAVQFAEPVIVYEPAWIPNDPYLADQWGIFAISAPVAWDLQRGSHSIEVAVIDLGTDYTHNDLAAAFGVEKGYDFVDNDSDPFPSKPNEKHGTHVSGIIAATMNNSTGIAGVSNIRLYSVRAGDSLIPYATEGVYWAADNGMRVANMSFGTYTYSSDMHVACNYAYNQGVLLVAASHNHGRDSITYPARFGSVIAVGAIDESWNRASFSNYGDSLELVGPGVDILSTTPGNSYESWPGTSMSCPFVTGVAALLFSDNSSLSNQDIRWILNLTATDLGDFYQYGYGLVNAWMAVVCSGNYDILIPSEFEEPYFYFGEDYQMYYEASRVSSAQPAELRQIIVRFTNESIFNKQKNVSALAWQNNGGVPGGELYRLESSVFLKPNTSSWIAFPVSSGTHVDGDFWIGHYEKSKGFPTSSIDTIPSPGVNFYSENEVSWYEDDYDYLQYAVVKYTTGVSEVLPKRGDLSFGIIGMSPNPFKDILTISFMLHRGPENLNLSVYDIAGRQVRMVNLHEYEAGVYDHTLDLNRLSSGIYFVSLSSNRHSSSVKVVKL